MVDTVSVTVTPEGKEDASTEEASSLTPDNSGLPSDGPQRPEGVPEKFWDAEKGEVRTEALLKSYGELERSRQEPSEEAETKPEEKPKEAEEATEDKSDAEKVVEEAGINFSELETHFAEHGELSQELYDKLEKQASIPRHAVDAYIAGVAALDAQVAQGLTEVAGGADNLSDIATWANRNLSEAEVETLNKQFASRDVVVAKEAMTKLRAKYAEAEGIAPSLVSGETATSAGDVYKSTAQVTKDMSDPRYKSDPAFRASVTAKIQRSNVL